MKNKFYVVLEESYYFPEAGGQPADHGCINGLAVASVLDTNPI